MSKHGGMSKKSRRQAVRNLEAQIGKHERKLANDSGNPAARHWRLELAAFKPSRRAAEAQRKARL
jgi:hypothetical protein